MIEIIINGRTVAAKDGDTVLNTARRHSIPIPHLCFHPALKPSGACRLCGVEVGRDSGKKMVMLSCILKVKSGLEIRTESDLVTAHRQKAFEKLLSMAPDSEQIRTLAEQFNVTLPPKPDGCIRCRLCVRVCSDVIGARAIAMVKTQTGTRVGPGDGDCIGCGTCANLCPTQFITVEDQDNIRTVFTGDRILSRLPLERCDACGIRYATAPFLGHVADSTTDLVHVGQGHKFCPECTRVMSSRTHTHAHVNK
nr:2Fe-2S iron-sulfur cluster-binding protein [uncultured Desulfobacter sp.]